MTIRLFFAAACVAVAAGCTTSSGLTYNNDVITLANGTQAHRVQCLGLAGSTESCMDQVKKICGDKQALRVSAVDRAVSGLKPENDPREITVTCATPVAQQPVPQAAPQPVPQPAPVVAHAPARKVTLQGDANFELNSASLTPAAKASLDEFIAANRGVDIQQLTIAGYTDSTGSTAERSAVRGTCACGSGVSRFAWPARDQRQRERLRQRRSRAGRRTGASRFRSTVSKSILRFLFRQKTRAVVPRPRIARRHRHSADAFFSSIRSRR
jgi:OmpA-OmpF porin, OOP family